MANEATTKERVNKYPYEKQAEAVTPVYFTQEEDGVLIRVGDRPVMTLRNCALTYSASGLTIQKGNELIGVMEFSEGGGWLARITGIELIPT